MRALFIPISPEDWQSKEMDVVVQQAKDSARKIRKGIDIRLERKRFSNACNRIEDLALKDGNNKYLKIDDAKGQLLLDKLPTDNNTRFPFFEPEDINVLLKNNILSELKGTIPPNNSIVAILQPSASGKISLKNNQNDNARNIKHPEPDYSVCDINLREIGEENKRFHQQIRAAIETGKPIGWINMEGESKGTKDAGLVRHEALITAIREYIYVKEQPRETIMVKATKEVIDEAATQRRDGKLLNKIASIFGKKPPILKKIEIEQPKIIELPIEPIDIRFAYSDGSIGEKFPLFCLAPKEATKGLPIIRAALISSRHFDLDSSIDTCIIRNSEIGRREDASIAEQEQLSFEIAYNFLLECLNNSDGVELHLYHTGLEPAVIGTYRAILEMMQKSDQKYRDRLMVIPKMFRGSGYGYIDLKPWN